MSTVLGFTPLTCKVSECTQRVTLCTWAGEEPIGSRAEGAELSHTKQTEWLSCKGDSRGGRSLAGRSPEPGFNRRIKGGSSSRGRVGSYRGSPEMGFLKQPEGAEELGRFICTCS